MSYAFRHPSSLPPQIDPETLLSHLQKSAHHFKEVLEELKATPEELARTLADPKTSELLKTRTHLAALNLKLLALQYAPHAFAKLVNLMSAEKPEVARRASVTILHLAGIPTDTKSPEPATPTPAPTSQEQHLTPEHAAAINEFMTNHCFAQTLAEAGLKLEDIHYSTIPTLVETVLEKLKTIPPDPSNAGIPTNAL